MTYQEEFITFMVRSGVLTFGDFTTKSGRKTPYFINTGNYKTGAQAARLGDYYAACLQEHLPADTTALFGPAYKGIPLAVSAAASLYRNYGRDLPYCFNRKEVKDQLRQEYGIDVHPIVTVRDIIDFLYERPIDGKVYIDHAMKERMEAYLRQYGAEQ